MRIGAMLSDILGSLFQRPATQLYPFERFPAPVQFRGALNYDPDHCAGCQLCVKDCPSNALELIVLDRVNKRFILRYHIDKCTYCAQCVQSCRFKCLHMSSEQWELAATNKEPFLVNYGRIEDVNEFVEREANTQINPSHLG
jgi:formate hydrogenlyase subunit 6/NADH:ubiquinone oxidoreductase subunit I